MKIRSIRHKGLKRLMETGSGAGPHAVAVGKIRTILAFLQAMATEEELRALPVWKPHMPTGDRSGIWALHVTANWRITYAIDREEIEIYDFDYEDYH